ncbi:MAG: hypothetical protein AB8G16_03740 [Gammaproteobacteria bacterium]
MAREAPPRVKITKEEGRRILALFEILRDVPPADRVARIHAEGLSEAGHQRLEKMLMLSDRTSRLMESMDLTSIRRP